MADREAPIALTPPGTTRTIGAHVQIYDGRAWRRPGELVDDIARLTSEVEQLQWSLEHAEAYARDLQDLGGLDHAAGYLLATEQALELQVLLRQPIHRTASAAAADRADIDAQTDPMDRAVRGELRVYALVLVEVDRG